MVKPNFRLRHMRNKSHVRLLLSRPIAFHPVLVDICDGSITAALFLSQAIYYSEITLAEDGWFWKKCKEWEAETRLSRREQDTARERLVRLGFLQEQLRNSPPVMHFKVNFNMLESAILNLAESAKLDGGKRQIDLYESAKSYKEAETTTEITTKNTKPIVAGRHARVQKLLMDFYASRNFGAQCPWDGGEGKMLKAFLSSVPGWTDQQIIQCLKNMYSSVGFAKGTRPRDFLSRLPKYLGGPLDEFNKEKASTGVSRADRRSIEIHKSTERVFREFEEFHRNDAGNLSLEDGRRGNEDLVRDAKRLLISGVREGDDGTG